MGSVANARALGGPSSLLHHSTLDFVCFVSGTDLPAAPSGGGGTTSLVIGDITNDIINNPASLPQTAVQSTN